MKLKTVFLIVLCASSIVLSGCHSPIENITPKTIPQNPSNIYQIAVRAKHTSSRINYDSYAARIVIDGTAHSMIKEGKTLFTFDYKMDENKHKAAYYYEIDYVLDDNKKTTTSKIFELNIANRYAVGLECNRGRPYAEISLLGRGFVPGDSVEIGESICDTVFVSPNVLAFKVPLVRGGRSYKAILSSENGDIGLGDFFVDTLLISATPSPLLLSVGEKKLLTISIDFDAPKYGMQLDVTTDIPESIIMHDVSIRGGARSSSVVVEGGEPGNGMLFINAPGFTECRIPVSVAGKYDENLDDGEYYSLTD